LIALSVTPVGSLHGSTEAPASAPAQIAFDLPAQPSSAPSLGNVLVELVTTTQVLGMDELTGAHGALVEMPGADVGSPAVVFDEALKRVSESSPLPADDAAIAVAPDLTSQGLPPGPERSDTAAHDEPLLALNAVARSWEGEPPGEPRREGARTEPRPPKITPGDFERADPAGARAGAVEEDAGASRLARLAWGAALACAAVLPVVLIKRRHAVGSGPGASFGSDPSTVFYGHPGPHAGLAGPKGDRNRRPPRMKRLLSRPARAGEQGLCS
jgi:hypothetical protein